MKPKSLVLAIAGVTLGLSAVAAEDLRPDKPRLEVIKIIGSRGDVKTLAGSGAIIDEKQLEIEVATDINQLMKTVPGVYVREEEGFGQAS